MNSRRDFLRTLVGGASAASLLSCTKKVPAPAGADLEAAELVADTTFDVCVVGSGPVGAILACEMARRGFSTLMVEGGEVSRSGGLRSGAYPVDATRFEGVGGTSNLWAGGSSRLQPSDFSVDNPFSPEEAPWPMDYAAIEPYYARAEQELEVHGEGPSSFAAPRSGPYPVIAMPGFGESSLVRTFESAGLTLDYPPISGKAGLRIASSHVPRFLSHEGAVFLRGFRVVRVDTSASGRTTGLEARTADGSALTLRARAYVLACGGIECARLLLLSRSDAFPTGIGNGRDLVGRHFMEHEWMYVGDGTVEAVDGGGWDGRGLSWEFYATSKAEGHGGVVFECSLRQDPSGSKRGRVVLSAVIEMPPSAENRVQLDGRTMDGFGLPRSAVFIPEQRALGALRKAVLARGKQILGRLGARDISMSGEPREWCHHHMGTCRMGANPMTSVLDPNLRVHGTSDLYVAGSACFVTGGTGGPTVLGVALAVRLADHLTTQL